ncbi:hypothetical protein RFI02_12005 [Acinetobacter sichuanensis]|uniref:hypothetical protein n=1 Tax=Acinetobacter sichuanensis TaxID=2136183 RepID=UPI0028103636|nr:hypothetical protein [Acinetobacter sichuanensis]MDQ9021829.1 hypothetical protein [Acinetobacter sichuanensis]
MLHKHLLSNLHQIGRIVPVHPTQMNQRIDDEIVSLNRLQQRNPCYLNQYDQLFRLITVWLLTQGYDLTNYQPHQVLKAVCLLNCPDWDIEKVIEQRHLLKKQKVSSDEIDAKSVLELQHCLHFFKTILQAYVSLSSVSK